MMSFISKIQIPFTIGIQTPTQFQAILQLNHNGAISMDATFGTNDVEYHLFTLMAFETTKSFKACGREKVMETFNTFNLDHAWTKYFWAYYCQLGKQLTHFKPFANILGFVDVIYELFKFFTPIKISPWPSYAMCMSMQTCAWWAFVECHIQIKILKLV